VHPYLPSDGEYVCKAIEGEELNPDDYLSKLSDWRDCSLWPTSSRQSEVIQRTVSQQQDPLAKEGVVGAFCRAYPIGDAIATFLPDIYEPSAMDGRYDYIPADSSAGVVLYDGKFAYSHHATDPACGKLLNAFDLVRVHKFSDLNDKESFKAMSDLAQPVLLLRKIHRRAAVLGVLVIELVAAQSDLVTDPFVLAAGAFELLATALQERSEVGLLRRLFLGFCEVDISVWHIDAPPFSDFY
jgi:hypothetical protein